MKNPIEMLNDIAAEITENASLLEVIYRIMNFHRKPITQLPV